MPWNKRSKPTAAKGLKGKSLEIFLAAANAALTEYEGDESRAIATGLAAAKRHEEDVMKSVSIEFDADKLTQEGKAGFLHDFISLVDAWFGAESEYAHESGVMKALNEEQRRALFVVLEPQEVNSTTDLHGDTYTAEEVEKACISFNTHCMKANIFHRVETENAKIEQSFISPAEFTLEDGRVIKQGTWLQWWSFPRDEVGEQLWSLVKSGEINGVSIGATAFIEDLE